MLQAVKLGVDFTSSTSVAIADTTFVISMRRRQDDYCSDGVAEEMPPDKKIFCLSRSHFGKGIVGVIVVVTDPRALMTPVNAQLCFVRGGDSFLTASSITLLSGFADFSSFLVVDS